MSSPQALEGKSFVNPDSKKFAYKEDLKEWEQAGKYAELKNIK